ncbi:hypothetical protein D5F01_LYC11387 [Larimichthys crocea]|uniref:t-SNARE coiled-coil homology domain-containing protein n=1 Tax=Larimichthys crocea TaxID=215358 RepID=A0A6G0IEI3_LARCR|nr:hypothetical protein D5F01_LYC11387 [Larimichthys crocea]
MKRRQRNTHDEDTNEDIAAAIKNKDPHPDIHPPESPSPSSSSPPSSISPATVYICLCSPGTGLSSHQALHFHGRLQEGDRGSASWFRSPIHLATAPSSKLVTPSSSMEFEAARRRLLEVEERQRVIREMERRLEELREVFVRSEQEVVVHGELVSRISSGAQQGEMYVAENSQRLKKGLRFKKHRPTIVFSSMLGLRTCLPWPVKLK